MQNSQSDRFVLPGLPRFLRSARSARALVTASTLCLLASAAIAETPSEGASTDSWPGFRGPMELRVDALPESFGLAVDWQRPLGAGYSSVAVVDGKIIALHTDGENDVISAIDARSGDSLWSLPLASKYDGHDGSDDGPLSTPAVADGRVYALGPKGQLVAAGFEDGKELWRTELNESNSSVPFYGYTSSPLPVADLVVVQTGGEQGALTAYDAATGEKRWAAGEDSVTYQSPQLVEIGGKAQIVSASDYWAHGLDPKSGEIAWSYRHAAEDSRGHESVHATQVGENRVLLNLDSESVMLDFSSGEPTEVWRDKSFSRTYVLPVYHEGHIFGFTGRILTAVNADTGTLAWRSRGASGQAMSLVDDQLAIFTNEGELVLAEANGTEYVETTRLQVFEAGDYADPAYAAGAFYVRNQEHLARVKVDSNAAPAASASAELPSYHGAFGAFLQGLEKKPEAERQAAVDAYFADVPSLPIIEDGGIVHIVHRGASEDVAVGGSLLGFEGREEVLFRVAGTDLFFRSFELDARSNYTYVLSVDYGDAAPDPANPNQVGGLRGVQSELSMPEFQRSAALADPAEDVARGTLDRFQFRSELLDNRRQIQVWLPPGYARSEEAYPVVVFHHGAAYVDNANAASVLDNLTGEAIEPVIAVFAPRIAGPEYNGGQADTYTRFLSEELLPHVDRHYRTLEGAENRAVIGIGSGAVISLHTALAQPGTFDKIALLSFYLTDSNRDAYWQMLDGSEAKLSRVNIATGPNDYDIPSAGLDSERSSNALAERLKAKGHGVEMEAVYGTAGWNSWRHETDRILATFFPAKASEEG